MNYEPVIWQNDQPPALDEDNLNHIEQGIKTASDSINELTTRVGTAESNITTINTKIGEFNIQSGTVHFDEIATGTYSDITVTYSTPFTSTTPTPVATLSTSGTAANIGNTTVSVHSGTKTNFKIRVYNNRGGSLSPAVTWISIGR